MIVKDKIALKAALIISLILVGLIGCERLAKAESGNSISFNGGVTVYCPLNETYSTNFLNLSLSAGLSAGVRTTLSYTIDEGTTQGPISLVYSEAGFPFYSGNASFELPYLSTGSHSLTIYEQSIIPDYHGANPPGAPFKVESSNSSNWIANWIDTVYFSVAPSPTWLTIDLAGGNYMNNVAVGQSVYFSAVVSNGVAPYRYQWYYQPYYVGTAIGDLYPTGDKTEGAASPNFTFTPNSTGYYLVEVRVWDSAGAEGYFMSLPPGIWVNAQNSTNPSPTATPTLSQSATTNTPPDRSPLLSPSPSIPEFPTTMLLPILVAVSAIVAASLGVRKREL